MADVGAALPPCTTITAGLSRHAACFSLTDGRVPATCHHEQQAG